MLGLFVILLGDDMLALLGCNTKNANLIFNYAKTCSCWHLESGWSWFCATAICIAVAFCYHTIDCQTQGFLLAINEGAAEVDQDALPIRALGWRRPFRPSARRVRPVVIGIYRKSASWTANTDAMWCSNWTMIFHKRSKQSSSEWWDKKPINSFPCQWFKPQSPRN